MARNHRQVIEGYRNLCIELEALGLRNYVMESYYFYIISEQTKYSPETIRKIISKYEKTKDHAYFETFLKTIPNIYNKLRKSLIKIMVNTNISED